MNKLNAKMRVTEVDSLSDALVRLYKVDAGIAQDAFVKASDEYTAASSAKGESASSVKKPLVSAINDRLVPYLTAMAMANGTVYGDFALKAEKEISRVNETVSRRGK